MIKHKADSKDDDWVSESLLEKENIVLDYQDNLLSIRARQEQKTEEKDKEGRYIRRERSSRAYSRQFLIENVKEEEITASFENGVLTINLPKTDEKKTETKRIEIE